MYYGVQCAILFIVCWPDSKQAASIDQVKQFSTDLPMEYVK